MRKTLMWAVLAGVVMIGCDEPTEPEDVIVPTEDLIFTRFRETISLPARDTFFVAVAGQDARFELHTDPEPGETEGEEFFEFRLDDESLLRRPDGTTFQPGDTVTIHVTIPGDDFIFYFEPSGLVFHPDEPAEMRIRYAECDDDLDADGDVDDDDVEFEGDLAVWRQENPGDPWVRLGAIHEIELDEIEVDIASFTGFALAGN